MAGGRNAGLTRNGGRSRQRNCVRSQSRPFFPEKPYKTLARIRHPSSSSSSCPFLYYYFFFVSIPVFSSLLLFLQYMAVRYKHLFEYNNLTHTTALDATNLIEELDPVVTFSLTLSLPAKSMRTDLYRLLTG